MKNKIILIGILITSLLRAGSPGCLSGEILNFGAGARTMGMGRVGTGLCDDASAPYYNPAGIYQINPQEILFMHTMLPMGASYDYLSYIHPTENFGSFGISLVHAGVDGVEDRDENNNLIGEFGESELVTMISYAKNVGSLISFGMNYKVVYHSISHWSDFGQGIDLSTLVLPDKPVSFGFIVKNVVKPRLTLRESEDTYPLILRSGLSYKTLNNKLTVSSDMSWSEYKGFLFYGGFEYQIHRYIELRWGLEHNFTTYGLGFNFPLPGYTIRVDYAFLNHHSGGGFYTPTHNLSLSLEFGGFRAKIHPDKEVFSPTSPGKENLLWLEKEVETRGRIIKWQIIIKNAWGEVLRTYEAWGELPLRLCWDGRDGTGNIVPDGNYYYELVVTDAAGRSYTSEGKLATVKTKGPEGKIILEERIDTLEVKPDTLIQFEEKKGPKEESGGKELE